MPAPVSVVSLGASAPVAIFVGAGVVLAAIWVSSRSETSTDDVGGEVRVSKDGSVQASYSRSAGKLTFSAKPGQFEAASPVSALRDRSVASDFRHGLGRVSTGLLLSGGMDSIALAWSHRPEYAITVDYGQKAAQAEIAAASAVCDQLGIRHVVQQVGLAALGSGNMAGLPALAEAPVPEWWSFRNQMLVTVAAMALIGSGVRRLLIGCLATDSVHADGSREFVAAMDALLAMQEGGMRLEAPASAMTAPELVRAAGVPPDVLAWAHSCHVANHACGICRGCQKHFETLEALGSAPY